MSKLLITLLLLSSFSVSAQQPQFKGGFPKFLTEHIIYPGYAKNNCIQGTVSVGFKLNTKGTIYYSDIIKSIFGELDDEALRLVRMSTGKWTVPIGYDTTSMVVVPVNFILTGYDCDRKSKTEIARATQTYENQKQLTEVVINFYRNKEKGNYKPEDESKVELIKKELEIDDEYLDRKISAGLKKYNQGDKQGACEDFIFVKYMGSDKANEWLSKYCK
jgi:hypothetical protein